MVALDIHNFTIAHNMRLNPTKCKETHINFLRNSNCLVNPIIIGGNVINSVNTCKILGVIMDNACQKIKEKEGHVCSVFETCQSFMQMTHAV